MTGTRRMWSRRVLRAGWALARILKLPFRIWRFFFGSKESAWWTIIISLVLFGFGSCTNREIRLSRVATVQEIEAAMKGNACMLQLMPRRQKLDKKGGPLTNYDLLRGKRDCEEHHETVNQIETMKKLGAIK